VHASLIYVKRSTPNRLIYKKSRRHAKNIITEVVVANTQFICGSIRGALLNFRKKMVLVFLTVGLPCDTQGRRLLGADRRILNSKANARKQNANLDRFRPPE